MSLDDYNTKWPESDEEDDEYVQNDTPPPDLDEQFMKNILEMKHKLYDDIILSPSLGTKEAQDNTLIEKYIKQLNNVYILTINAKKGILDESSLTQYTPKTREQIKNILVWISDFFKRNHISDTIPYDNYLHNMFHVYPFVQDKTYE
jgi:hypothetical protein